MSRATIGWGAVVGLLVAALLATSAAPASGQDAPEGDDGAAAVGASALAPILQYTGGTPLDAAGASFPGLQTFDALADATHRDVVTAATLPADLAAYRCVVLNGMTAPYGNGDMAALSAYVQGGGTLVTTAESDGIPGGPDTQAVQNQLLAALGSVVENLHGAEDLGFRTTGTIAADPLTAGVDEVRYGNTGVLSAGAPARPLVTGEGGQVILAAEALGAGTLVVASDMNVLSDRSDTGYVSQDNGRLADNLCGGVGFLSGTVWEEGFGDMVAGVHVAVLRTSDFSIAAGDISSTPHGHFDVALDVGSYFLYLIDPSGRHVSGFFGPPTTIDVAAGELETAQPTMAPARGSLSGTVTDDATAAPVPGAWAVAIGPDGIAGATVTAGDGTYTLPHLAPGTYRATFADPAGGRLQEYYDDQPDYDGASPLPVTVGATTGDVDAALAAGPGRGTAAVDVVAGGSHSCALLDD
ncbi:MAG: carboxypeptidase regulatory-like domain-containing protein, partial [Acidimicrobiales bacterium]|nr:carboxypeptidase regulatory-like domain-containing protein [Acidimicrobiales bacterium]